MHPASEKTPPTPSQSTISQGMSVAEGFSGAQVHRHRGLGIGVLGGAWGPVRRAKKNTGTQLAQCVPVFAVRGRYNLPHPKAYRVSGRVDSTTCCANSAVAAYRLTSLSAGKRGTVPLNGAEHGPCVRPHSRAQIVPSALESSVTPGGGQPISPCHKTLYNHIRAIVQVPEYPRRVRAPHNHRRSVAVCNSLSPHHLDPSSGSVPGAAGTGEAGGSPNMP